MSDDAAQYFADAWSFEEFHQARDLLARVIDIGNRLNIKLFIDSGTLLGYARMGTMLPWDDDLDLGVIHSDEADGLAAAAAAAGLQVVDGGTHKDFRDFLKLCDPAYAPVTWKSVTYTWPFIDVFIFDRQGSLAVGRSKSNNAKIPLDLILPLRGVSFLGLDCWVPADVPSVLDVYYADWRVSEVSTWWDHRHEREAPAPRIRPIDTAPSGLLRHGLPPEVADCIAGGGDPYDLNFHPGAFGNRLLQNLAIRRDGCRVTGDVPILMYHRISSDGPAGLAPFRVAPEMFERQLSWLSRQGYVSIGLDAYHQRRFVQGEDGFPGKPIVLTFDDAYSDFITHALPLLKRYGFGAIVFVPTDYVGGSAEWDKRYGDPAPLMTWDELRQIKSAGIEFGSHSCCHRLVTNMKPDELLTDSLVSRTVLETELQTAVTGYCYPYGSANEASREVIRSAGYRWAVCGVPEAPLSFADPCYLPRIEIVGGESLEQFIRRIPRRPGQ